MAIVYVTKHASASNLNDGSNATTQAWETAIYGFTNVGASNTLKFGTGTYDIDRSSLQTPIPNGSSGDHTIITDNADGVVTFNHPGSGFSGLLWFSDDSNQRDYITFQATSKGNIVFDMEKQSFGNIVYQGGSVKRNKFQSYINIEFKRANAGSGFGGGRGDDFIFRGCVFHDNGPTTKNNGTRYGCYHAGLRTLVEDCEFYDNYTTGLHLFGTSCNGSIIRNNKAYHNGYMNDGAALSHDAGSSNSSLSSGLGLFDHSGSVTVYNNLCYDNFSNGIDVWLSNSTIYHNVCYDNGGETFGGFGILLGQNSTPSNTEIKNNLCIDNAVKDIKILSSATGTVASWNRTGVAIQDFGSSTLSNNSTGAVAADIWTLPGSGDFTLKAGSAAIWNATTNDVPSVGITTDFTGASRSHPDQGAYAYGTPDPPDPPVIGHNTNYPVARWTLENIALTIFDNDGNTVNLTLNGSTDGVSVEFGDTTNCTVT